MGRKRVFSEVIKETVDQQTGEVMEYATLKRGYMEVDSTEHFIMMYIEFLRPFYNLKPETAKNVLMWMCEHAQWDSGLIQLATKTRTTMMQELNISAQTLSNCLTSLKKARLISGEKGEFRINPFVFWKGSRDKRRELLKDAAIKATFEIVPKSEMEKAEKEKIDDSVVISMDDFENE